MSMVIKNNMDAMRTLNQMTANHALAHKHLMKVSTGMKVRNAQDDASAYAISEHMRVRIRALEQAHSNTQNGSNMMKTAEGAVAKIVDALRTLKEKAINAANDSNTDEDRRLIQREFDQLADQIDEDALITFNNKYLIDGTRNNAFQDTPEVFFNNRLAANTTEATALTDLADRTGNSLGIQATDKYQIAVVINGKLTTVSDTVGSKTIGELLNADEFDGIGGMANVEENGMILSAGVPYNDKFGQFLYSPSGEAGLSVSSDSPARFFRAVNAVSIAVSSARF